MNSNLGLLIIINAFILLLFIIFLIIKLISISKKLKTQYVQFDKDDPKILDLTNAKNKSSENENTMQKRFRQSHIEYIFTILYQTENTSLAIRRVLELVAKHFSFERAYIFETSRDGKTSSNTVEWCDEGVTAEIKNLQSIPINEMATSHSHFQQSGVFILRSTAELPPPKREEMERQGIKSMFQFGIFDKSRLLGFIGFDNCKSEFLPNDNDLEELKTICRILATFFVKQYIDEVSERDLLARQDVMNHLENYIYVINIETFELLFMNSKIQTLLDSSKQSNACYNFFRGNECQCDDCPIRQLVRDSKNHLVSEIYNDNLKIWMKVSASLMRWTDGNLACLMNCTDITKQKNEQTTHLDQMKNMLYIDPLTGGHTYQKFQIDAQRFFDEHKNSRCALVKLDIANFKLINQIYGFEKGNEILCHVAKAMELTLQSSDGIFARISNDEFITLFTVHVKSEAENLHKIFYKHFLKIVGKDFSFKFKFPHGRYIIEPGMADKIEIHEMFEKVNIAHKAAKSDKTLDYVFYDEQMTKEALRIKGIENAMTDALKNDEFLIYLQPKYHLKDETIGGAEALARWGNEKNKRFSPNNFIPIFEQNGFITQLDLYIFEKACETIKSWIDDGEMPVTISVNFSRLHLNNPDFVKGLCDIADRIGVDRKYLEIEITETAIFDNSDSLELLLNDIHKNGFTMSMDDFGSGYSSLGMLKDFPVDVIKMDRSFFANQRDTKRSKIVVDSIIKMATNLDIHIVAEGVEEQNHIDFLRELECDIMVQGYFYAKPMPIDSFTNLLKTERGIMK